MMVSRWLVAKLGWPGAIAPGLVGVIALALTSCATGPNTPPQNTLLSPQNAATPGSAGTTATPTPGAIATPSPSPAAGTSATSPAPNATPSPAIANGPQVTVTIYKADAQCVNFVPQRVQVPENDPMNSAVGKLLGLEGRDTGEFDLSGYRVTVNSDTGEATVDLRMNPNSKRQIVSLSACEQFSLFGSLRETLTKNPQWKIQSVRFTERGKDIVL